MDGKRWVMFGAGGVLAVAAIAAAAWALAPGPRGLAAMDADGDGRIVNAEVQQEARRRFAEQDSNRDGRLTGDELPRGHGRGRHQRGVEGLDGRSGNEASAASPPRRGLAAADRNGDGALDLREFYAGLLARTARADDNGDGIVSTGELAERREHRRRRH